MQVFDAPNRDYCVVRRDRTNTPLQALLTMNDVQFVESARVMAARSLEGRLTERERLVRLFRSAVTRHPHDDELAVLRGSLDRFRRLYAAQPELAADLLRFGEMPDPSHADAAEQAAWTMVCNQILNLDEFVMKE
jgi:hypothetical protein